jgi:hypothetical protein
MGVVERDTCEQRDEEEGESQRSFAGRARAITTSRPKYSAGETRAHHSTEREYDDSGNGATSSTAYLRTSPLSPIRPSRPPSLATLQSHTYYHPRGCPYHVDTSLGACSCQGKTANPPLSSSSHRAPVPPHLSSPPPPSPPSSPPGSATLPTALPTPQATHPRPLARWE